MNNLRTPKEFKQELIEYTKDLDLTIEPVKKKDFAQACTTEAKNNYTLRVINEGLEEVNKDETTTTTLGLTKFIEEKHSLINFSTFLRTDYGQIIIKSIFDSTTLTKKEHNLLTTAANQYYYHDIRRYRYDSELHAQYQSFSNTGYLLINEMLTNTKNFIQVIFPALIKSASSHLEINQLLEFTFDNKGQIVEQRNVDKEFIIELAFNFYLTFYNSNTSKELKTQ